MVSEDGRVWERTEGGAIDGRPGLWNDSGAHVEQNETEGRAFLRMAGGWGQTVSDMVILVTGLFLSNESTIGAAIDLLALVLREASRDRR